MFELLPHIRHYIKQFAKDGKLLGKIRKIFITENINKHMMKILRQIEKLFIILLMPQCFRRSSAADALVRSSIRDSVNV